MVEVSETGEDAIDRLARQPAVDLVVLDVMLPGCDGFHVARHLRHIGQYLPVLILTARGHAEDILRGFAAGADDYLVKPFDLSIFIARVQGLLRRWDWMRQLSAGRGGARAPDRFAFGTRTIDFDTLEVLHGEDRLQLTAMEAKLLRYLVQHQGRNVSRKEILEEVWEVHEDTDTRAIDNFVVRLRRYIEDDPTDPKHLLTVRGVGYRFVPGGNSEP